MRERKRIEATVSLGVVAGSYASGRSRCMHPYPHERVSAHETACRGALTTPWHHDGREHDQKRPGNDRGDSLHNARWAGRPGARGVQQGDEGESAVRSLGMLPPVSRD
jgi:hypothetical protein